MVAQGGLFLRGLYSGLRRFPRIDRNGEAVDEMGTKRLILALTSVLWVQKEILQLGHVS